MVCAVMVSLAVSLVTPNVGDTTRITLPGGNTLRLEEVRPFRNITFTFFDQALASIPAIYPNSRIMIRKRDGEVERSPSVIYSVVAYAMSAASQTVKVEGMAEVESRAWSFDLEAQESKLAETMLELVKELSRLPEITAAK